MDFNELPHSKRARGSQTRPLTDDKQTCFDARFAKPNGTIGDAKHARNNAD